MEKYLEHYSGDEAFCRMIVSLKDQVIEKNMWHLTPFYNPHEVTIIERLIGHQDDLVVYHHGGSNRLKCSASLLHHLSM